MIVVGKNCIPAISSAMASSPSANKKGDNPNVMPLMSNICNADKMPFKRVVPI
jgi:hypothetical protein